MRTAITFSQACYSLSKFKERSTANKEYEPVYREITLFVACTYKTDVASVEKEVRFWSDYERTVS